MTGLDVECGALLVLAAVAILRTLRNRHGG